MWVFKKFSKCFASNKSAKMFYLKRVISFDSLEKCSKFKKRKEKKAIFCLVILLSKVISSMASKVNFQDKEKNRRIFPNF